MDVATATTLRPAGAPRLRGLELSAQLRAAIMDSDDVRITCLLSELVRVKGFSRGQRIALQFKALQNLVQALRLLAISDEATGLCNRRGFVQSASRLLDLAVRDKQVLHLVYFQLGQRQLASEAVEPPTSEIVVRQMANLLRDLFPNYGVYEALGRLSATEFAALTPSVRFVTHNSILLRVRRAQQGCDVPTTRLSVATAHFDPQRPATIEELLQSAQQAMQAHERVARFASCRLAPLNGVTLC
jgi:GGDEF domain-containing protein